MTTAEHFERTPEQDRKQKLAKLLALQVNVYKARDPKQHLGLTYYTSLGVHHQNGHPKMEVLAVINWDTEKEFFLTSPMQILLKCPHTYFQKREPHMGPLP